MPDFHVIANVSETLVSLLTDALQAVDPLGTANTAPVAMLHDLHTEPRPQGDAAGVLAVTLVEAREDGSARNRPRIRHADPSDPSRVSIAKPPMAWILRYLMTPWSRTNPSGASGEERDLEHRMLGRIAQFFYDGAILSGGDLKGSGDDGRGEGLAGSSESLKITLLQRTFEEQTGFWHAVQMKYRVSLTYDVRVVNLESTQSQSLPRVTSPELEYGVVENS